MGSSNSRLGSRRPRPRVNRSIISSLICGGSDSRSTYQVEEQYEQIREVQNPRVESSLSASSRTGFTSSNTEIVANLNGFSEDGLRSIGTSNSTFLSECKELTSPDQVSTGCGHDESSMGTNHSTTTSSTLFKEQQSSDAVSVIVSPNAGAVNGIGSSAHNGAEVMHPSSSPTQGRGSSCSDTVPSDENHTADVMAIGSSGSDSHSVQLSNPPVPFHPFGSEPLHEVIPSGLGFLVSNRERARADGGLLQVDVVSISSNVLSNSNPDASNREARRNSRRLFWDAFSRRSSRRLIDSPTIVFSMDDNEELGSHDRWLLGFSGDFFDEGNGIDSRYLGSRIPYSSERRRHSRSEVWERLRGGLDEYGRRSMFCPSGHHPDGTCSCESLLMNEESTTRASISRIVMLAEALFEVLDEIHRQPVSLSLSMVSSPAPASVVDSFPLKSHSRLDKADARDEVSECYICLAEYEEGDKIRVLPCQHEYHMSCVDKWLKEIHGVCPLCRGDVRENLTDNSEIPSV
ncbi:uncharacterized protein LOC21389849 [Morus notabilis]|uniref:uncharacterized protein LOC21389849 n=1 Tax=Morus notabilis TaxID=981085 RepID=UPI000CED3A8F|nr:uncharacterized protein LOC21389849 [Morus notabilis]